MTNTTTTSTWEDKAHRVIADLCATSYHQANTRKDGTRYKKHRSYSIPFLAERLIECLNTNNELEAKAIFIGMACVKGFGNV